MLILLEYAENGSLDKFLQTHELNEGQRLQMAMDVCGGLAYLHSNVNDFVITCKPILTH